MLGIIIINFNTYEKTIECISSIKDTYSGDYKIYLLDNASKNESCVKLNEKYIDDEKVELIFSDENLGYARGNNLCLKKAKEDGCDYALISNNDIIYKPHAIENLVKEIVEEDAFLVGPKVIKPSGETQGTVKYHRPSFIEYMTYETYARNFVKKSYEKHKLVPKTSQDVYWIAGCTFIVDVEKFEKIGFFDDYTFLFYEEFILSEKAKKAGYRERYCVDSEVIHHHGASMGGPLNIITRSANWRSESYFIREYLNWGIVKRWLLWQMRVLEIKFNARKESNKKELVSEYKVGKKFLFGI
ncbi:hypothetical protein SAMN05421493_12424 [Pseudobutyrivibrio sp. 49]|uniref:glycosyltransferase n=1 Tax=Pseudobutyrivibrio sp. 49 TaxID=1855344 RepID=UPI0008862A83|nr:glycosyltransferase family 2 protein [Pseudobutyrivibrio sp. 49]SDI72316.1 hypothetical protein SAMN05421493_12424 [Pseudobutyrivibrio sp. 49]